MAKMTGMAVKLFVVDNATGNVLAGQRNASLKRTADAIDSTSKDTAGFWKESLQGFKSWSIDGDGCFIEGDAAYATLENAFLNSENVDIYIELPSGTKYQGNATIKEMSLEFPYDSLSTYKLSFDGSGALVTTTGTPA